MKKHLFLFMNFIPGLTCAGLEKFYFKLQLKNQKDLFVMARPAVGTDLTYFNATYGNEQAMSQYMGGGIRPKEEIEARLKLADDRTKNENPWNVWLYFASETKESLGKESVENFLGLTRYQPSDRVGQFDEIEISYVIQPSHWNKGIGTKLVEEFLKKAQEWRQDNEIEAQDGQFYDVRSVYATARADHPGSCHVLEKNGFTMVYKNEKFNLIRRFYWRPIAPKLSEPRPML